jgi:hypothetical protein
MGPDHQLEGHGRECPDRHVCIYEMAYSRHRALTRDYSLNRYDQGGAVAPGPDPSFDDEPLGGEKEGGRDGAGDRPAVG